MPLFTLTKNEEKMRPLGLARACGPASSTRTPPHAQGQARPARSAHTGVPIIHRAGRRGIRRSPTTRLAASAIDTDAVSKGGWVALKITPSTHSCAAGDELPSGAWKRRRPAADGRAIGRHTHKGRKARRRSSNLLHPSSLTSSPLLSDSGRRLRHHRLHPGLPAGSRDRAHDVG